MTQPEATDTTNSPSHSMLHRAQLNVKAFGAVGNGVVDDTAAIQAAITVSNSDGGSVFFPPGTYKMTSTITITGTNGVHLVGGTSAGITGLSQFHWPPSVRINVPGGTTPAFTHDSPAAATTFENLRFVGAGLAVYCDHTGLIRFHNCAFECSLASQSPVVIKDSFWIDFTRCSIISPDTSTPAVQILSNDDNGPQSSYLIAFENTIFTNGGVQWEETNASAEAPGQLFFKYCHTENFALTGLPLLDLTSSAGGTSTVSTITMDNCVHYDPVGGGPPAYIRVGASAGALYAISVVMRNCGESDKNAIEVAAGGVLAGGVIMSARGAWKVNLNGGTVAAFMTTKEAGWQIISPIGGPGGAPTESSITGASGPAIRMAVVGEANARTGYDVDGTIYWGPGGGSGFDTNLYRSAADTLETDDKFIAGGGIGVGNSAAATGPVGNVVKKIQVFDASGASLGYIPVYDAIT